MRGGTRTRRFRFRGLRVVYERLPGSTTALALAVRAGARFDGRRPGLAHMAEHMLFQGTRRLDQWALNRRAAEVGGGHNATTGYETISLTIETFNGDVGDALGLLAEQFYETRIDPARFRKERRIVLDEIRSIEDDPLEYLNERAWRAFFGAPIGHPIAGTRSALAEKAADVVGGASERSLRRALEASVRADRAGRAAAGRGAAPGRAGRLRVRGGPRGQSFATRLIEVDARPTNLLALGLALDVVGADPDASLFQAVRERYGLGYDVVAELDWGCGWAAAVLSGSARAGRAERVAAVIEEVLERSGREGLPAADLARARRKRRLRIAAAAERRLDRAISHAESPIVGFPSLEIAEQIVAGLDDAAVQRAWRRALAGRSLLALLEGR